jgi:hypothetical protein
VEAQNSLIEAKPAIRACARRQLELGGKGTGIDRFRDITSGRRLLERRTSESKKKCRKN